MTTCSVWTVPIAGSISFLLSVSAYTSIDMLHDQVHWIREVIFYSVTTYTEIRHPNFAAFVRVLDMSAIFGLAANQFPAATLISWVCVGSGGSHVPQIRVARLEWYFALCAVVRRALVARRPSAAHYIADMLCMWNGCGLVLYKRPP